MSNNKSKTIEKIVNSLKKGNCVLNSYGSSYYGSSYGSKNKSCLDDPDEVKKLTSLFKKLSKQMGLNDSTNASMDEIVGNFVSLIKKKAGIMKAISNNEEKLNHTRAIGIIAKEFIQKVTPKISESETLNRPKEQEIITRIVKAIQAKGGINRTIRNDAKSILNFVKSTPKLGNNLATSKDPLINRLTAIIKNENVTNFNKQEIELLKKLVTGKIRPRTSFGFIQPGIFVNNNSGGFLKAKGIPRAQYKINEKGKIIRVGYMTRKKIDYNTSRKKNNK